MTMNRRQFQRGHRRLLVVAKGVIAAIRSGRFADAERGVAEMLRIHAAYVRYEVDHHGLRQDLPGDVKCSGVRQRTIGEESSRDEH